jgi:O-antigen ligase
MLGVGPAGYAIYYMTYFPREAMATHNNYIDVFAQTGVIGFIFFAWMLGAVGIQLWRSMIATQGQGDFNEAFSFAVFGGFVAVLCSMMLGDWIFPFIYTQTLLGFDYAVYSWVILGAGIALWNHQKSQTVIK